MHSLKSMQPKSACFLPSFAPNCNPNARAEPCLCFFRGPSPPNACPPTLGQLEDSEERRTPALCRASPSPMGSGGDQGCSQTLFRFCGPGGRVCLARCQNKPFRKKGLTDLGHPILYWVSHRRIYGGGTQEVHQGDRVRHANFGRVQWWALNNSELPGKHSCGPLKS